MTSIRQELWQASRTRRWNSASGDTTDRALLEELKAADYDHVIVLSYAGLEVQAADANTLVTLLHLRDIAEQGRDPLLHRQRDARPAQPRSWPRWPVWTISSSAIT